MSEGAAAANVLTSYIPVEEGERIWVFCDRERRDLAVALARVAEHRSVEAEVIDMSREPDGRRISRLLRRLTPRDVVICTFSHDFAQASPLAGLFPAFRRPEGFMGRSAYIRPHIPHDALVQMLCTDVDCARSRAAEALELGRAERLRVTAPSGTNLTFEPRGFGIIPFACEDHIFLPPAEVYTAMMPGSAEGIIVVDLTVGEFVRRGRCLDPMGTVHRPVQVTVVGGEVAGIRGGRTAGRLRELLSRCPPSCSKVVELGVGLSSGTVTGHIGADECLGGTCHFGLGDDRFYGGCSAADIHLDLVVDAPRFEVLSEKHGGVPSL